MTGALSWVALSLDAGVRCLFEGIQSLLGRHDAATINGNQAVLRQRDLAGSHVAARPEQDFSGNNPG
jgi:hypothetical protein